MADFNSQYLQELRQAVYFRRQSGNVSQKAVGQAESEKITLIILMCSEYFFLQRRLLNQSFAVFVSANRRCDQDET